MIKLREAEKERRPLDKRREREKLQAQLDHEAYIRNRDLKQQLKEHEKSDIGRTERARREGIEKVEQDIAMGLTSDEVRFKYLDENARIREMNEKAVKEAEASLKKANSFLSDMY